MKLKTVDTCDGDIGFNVDDLIRFIEEFKNTLDNGDGQYIVKPYIDDLLECIKKGEI